MQIKETDRPYTGPDYIPGADAVAVETYRKQAIALFGNTDLPAVQYKGRLYAARKL